MPIVQSFTDLRTRDSVQYVNGTKQAFQLQT